MRQGTRNPQSEDFHYGYSLATVINFDSLVNHENKARILDPIHVLYQLSEWNKLQEKEKKIVDDVISQLEDNQDDLKSQLEARVSENLRTKFSITVEGDYEGKIDDLTEFLEYNQGQSCLFERLRMMKFIRESNKIEEFLSLPNVKLIPKVE